MNSIRFIVAFILLSIVFQAKAQFFQKNDSLWRNYKKEFYFGFGATQFLGDLGGQQGKGKTLGVGDFNFAATSYEVHAGFRYRFHPLFATNTQLTFGSIEACDDFTTNEFRASRNMNIRSVLIDLSQRFEFIYFSKYKSKTKKNKSKTSLFQLYTFTGIGAVFFNPKGFFPANEYIGNDWGTYKYYGDDDWHALRELRTEGQGYPGGASSKLYKRFSTVIPFGFGMQKSISRSFSIKFELTYVKTFTDYMDDVSSASYYDFVGDGVTASPNQLYFADPSYHQEYAGTGKSRGGKGKDCYFLAGFSLAKSIGQKKQKPPVNE